jgi:SET domain-containing protein
MSFENFYYNNTKFILDIKPSNIKNSGNGLFSLQNIPNETMIGYYVGDILSGNNKVTDYSFQISKKYFIDAKEFPRCYIAMINDAKNSQFVNNCEFRIIEKKIKKNNKICLYSIKDIKRSDELFASYGDEYWTTRNISN